MSYSQRICLKVNEYRKQSELNAQIKRRNEIENLNGDREMKTRELPNVQLREFTLEDVEDRNHWCLEVEVSKISL